MPIPKSEAAQQAAEAEETNCLTRAQHITADRGDQYGHPADVYSVVAQIWSAILGMHVSPQQVGLCLMGLKLGREAGRHTRDNVDDMAGYAWVLEAVHKKEGTW